MDRSRPVVPDYGIPEDDKGLLEWDHVVERMREGRNYWIATVDSEARPHAVPVWGVWLNDAAFFGGGPDTRWARNLFANPKVSVHLESGDDVVILEGTVDRVEETPLVDHVADAYEAKYNFRHPPPFWRLRPKLVLAWTSFPKSTTRWRFD